MKLRLVIVAAAAFVATGCATSLKVNVLQPAPVNFGSSKRLSFVQGEGRRSAREYLVNEIANQTRAAGYYTFADRGEEGITVKVAGRQVQLTGGKAPQGPDEIYLRIDVLDWNANRETKSEQHSDGKGNTWTTQKVILTGKVVLGVTASNAQGVAVLAEKEYKGQFEGAENTSDDMVLQQAGRQAVTRLLGDITPHYVQKAIRIDDDDANQKPIIAVAKEGNLPKATEEMRAYLTSNPTSPAAMYNLAVLLDAQGQYQEALDLYTKAVAASTKDYYVQMKAECAKRLADAQALAQ